MVYLAGSNRQEPAVQSEMTLLRAAMKESEESKEKYSFSCDDQRDFIETGHETDVQERVGLPKDKLRRGTSSITQHNPNEQSVFGIHLVCSR